MLPPGIGAARGCLARATEKHPMSKLRLNREAARAEDAGAANPYRFPVEAARRLGAEAGEHRPGPGRGSRGGAGATATADGDVITQIEEALDRMQNRLDDLSDQIGSLRFPGVTGDEGEGPEPGPSAA